MPKKSIFFFFFSFLPSPPAAPVHGGCLSVGWEGKRTQRAFSADRPSTPHPAIKRNNAKPREKNIPRRLGRRVEKTGAFGAGCTVSHLYLAKNTPIRFSASAKQGHEKQEEIKENQKPKLLPLERFVSRKERRKSCIIFPRRIRHRKCLVRNLQKIHSLAPKAYLHAPPTFTSSRGRMGKSNI